MEETMRLKPVLAIIALSLAVAGTALAKETAKLSRTPAGKRVAAYFAAFNSGNEQTMREYMEKNVAPEALQQWSMEERLTVYRQMKEEMGGLTLRRVVETKENAVTVLAQSQKGDWFKLGFEFEPKGEHKLLGIRIENTEPPPDPNLPKLTEAQVMDSLEAYLTGECKADEFSGTVLVVRGGRTVYEKAFGLASREYNIPNRADTKYNLGSINKFFTKIAIGQLVQEGKLSFDDALGKILPEYPNPDARQKVTIRHLLTMTSGIGDFFGEEYDATPKDRIRSIRDYLPLFTGKPLAFEPGTQRKYSNGGYVVLGAVIEKITGGSYYDYVREHITKPAGMEDTDFFEADAPTPNLAMGYTRGEEGKQDSPWRSNLYTRPARGSSAGGGYSTAPDMLKFSQALKANKFLTPEYTNWLLNDREPSRGGKQTKSGGKEGKGGLGIAGGAPGINAMLEMDLERDNTVIVLSNYDPPTAVRVDRKIRGWLDRIKK
jgi:CubicO group peptidase (beta-lactamase class C family)